MILASHFKLVRDVSTLAATGLLKNANLLEGTTFQRTILLVMN
jgi:hypothetical protein